MAREFNGLWAEGVGELFQPGSTPVRVAVTYPFCPVVRANHPSIEGTYDERMHVTLRRASAADVSTILEMWRNADAEPTHTDDVHSVAQLISHDPAALIVVEADGRIVGSVIAGWDGWRGSIYRLVVTPEYRRQGLGSQLLHAAETRLADTGAVRLQAIVMENDSGALGFWRASAWEEQVERARFVMG